MVSSRRLCRATGSTELPRGTRIAGVGSLVDECAHELAPLRDPPFSAGSGRRPSRLSCTEPPLPGERRRLAALPAIPLEFLPLGRLASEQERPRGLALAADLEGPEGLVPGPLGSLGLRLAPQLELVEVLGRDPPLTESVEEVISQRRWKVVPPDLRHQEPKVRRAS